MDGIMTRFISGDEPDNRDFGEVLFEYGTTGATVTGAVGLP